MGPLLLSLLRSRILLGTQGLIEVPDQVKIPHSEGCHSSLKNSTSEQVLQPHLCSG